MPRWFVPFLIVGVASTFLIERWTRPDFSKESAAVNRAYAYRRCVVVNVEEGVPRTDAVEYCKVHLAATKIR